MNLLKALLETTTIESATRTSDKTPSTTPKMKPLWTSFAENKAIVTEAIAPNTIGHIKFRGTRWRACSDRPLPLKQGMAVRVIGRQRCNILVVEPALTTV